MLGAIVAGAIALVGSVISKNQAEDASRSESENRNYYSNLYYDELDKLQVLQEDHNLTLEDISQIQKAKYNRSANRQSSSSYADTEANAYVGGVGSSSSLQGYTGAFSLDTYSAITDVQFNYDINLLENDYNQEVYDVQRDADFYSSVANQYGAAWASSTQRMYQAESNIWGAAGTMFGGIAGFAA